MFSKQIKIDKGKGRANPIPTARGNPPVCIVDPVISGTVAVGNTLTSTSGTWTSTLTVFYMYQWQRNGNDIVGAISPTYVVVNADLGTNIRCMVTATNADGVAYRPSNTLTSSAVLAPVNTVLPVITGTTSQGSTLSVSSGTWTNSPTGYSYQWKADGVAISGAISSTYLLTAPEIDRTITCTVTATNAAGSASATSLGVGPVTAGSIPVNSVVPYFLADYTATTTPASTLSVGRDYFGNFGTWSGTPTSFTWQIKLVSDGSVYASGTATADGDPLFTPGEELAGVAIYLSVVAINGIGSSAAAVSVNKTVAAIDVSNAITSFTRTSSSGTIPTTASIVFGATAESPLGEIWFNRYDSTGATLLESSVSYAPSSAEISGGLTVNLSNYFSSYSADQKIEVVYSEEANGVSHIYTHTPKLSITDAPSFTKYRLKVTNTASGFYTLLAEFELYSTVGGANQANNAGFTISANNQAGDLASKARDNNFATYWATDFGGVAYPHIIEIDMTGGTPIQAVQYGLGQATGGGTAGFPKDFTFEGWNGSSWVVLDTKTAQTNTDGNLNKYVF
jgi:hypothetical protein